MMVGMKITLQLPSNQLYSDGETEENDSLKIRKKGN